MDKLKLLVKAKLNKVVNNVNHYENFPVASIILPSDIKKAIISIYNFARSADDIADEGDEPPYIRLKTLDEYSKYLENIENKTLYTSSPSIFIELDKVVQKHLVNTKYLHDLIKAFKQDIIFKNYSTKQQILEYCKYSANPVGRILLQVYKKYQPNAKQYSDLICTSLQLINFYQDIKIDYLKGRHYISRDILSKYGLSYDIIEQLSKSPHPKQNIQWNKWQTMLIDEVHSAQQMLYAGMPLAKILPLKMRIEIKCIIYAADTICKKIQKDADVFTNRPILKWYNWFTIIPRAIFN